MMFLRSWSDASQMEQARGTYHRFGAWEPRANLGRPGQSGLPSSLAWVRRADSLGASQFGATPVTTIEGHDAKICEELGMLK